LIHVDEINAFQLPSTSVVNAAKRASTQQVNSLQPKSTPGKSLPKQSGRIAAYQPTIR
jgi:hypothetical protein